MQVLRRLWGYYHETRRTRIQQDIPQSTRRGKEQTFFQGIVCRIQFGAQERIGCLRCYPLRRTQSSYTAPEASSTKCRSRRLASRSQGSRCSSRRRRGWLRDHGRSEGTSQGLRTCWCRSCLILRGCLIIFLVIERKNLASALLGCGRRTITFERSTKGLHWCRLLIVRCKGFASRVC
jgi:hypothetical protein